mgnify:CR=1 FL=1
MKAKWILCGVAYAVLLMMLALSLTMLMDVWQNPAIDRATSWRPAGFTAATLISGWSLVALQRWWINAWLRDLFSRVRLPDIGFSSFRLR